MTQLALVTNVILAFDEPIYAQGLKLVIKVWKGILDITLVHDITTLRQTLKNLPSELLIIDERFPGFNSPADIKNFAAKYNLVPILLFCHSQEKSTLHSLSNTNVSGLVSRKADKQNVAHAIRMVMAKKKYRHPDLFLQINAPQKSLQNDIHFSNREHDLISCLIKGLRPSLIYKSMSISADTYKQYRSQINAKVKPRGYASIEQFIDEITKN